LCFPCVAPMEPPRGLPSARLMLVAFRMGTTAREFSQYFVIRGFGSRAACFQIGMLNLNQPRVSRPPKLRSNTSVVT
jgi:hypothetical protein